MDRLATIIDLMFMRLRLCLLRFYTDGGTPEIIDELADCISELQREMDTLHQSVTASTKFLRNFTNAKDAADLAVSVGAKVWQRIGFSQYFVTTDPLMTDYFKLNPAMFRIVEVIQ